MNPDEPQQETRQERRERRLKAKRERMQTHGAGLRQTFADAALNLARMRLRRTSRRR